MKYCLLIVSALLLMTSCDKEPETTKSKQDILRADTWTLDTGFVQKKWKMDDDAVPADIDIVESYPEPACREDDQLAFRDGYEGAHIPGEVTCSINETSEIEFRWGLTDNDTRMFIYDAREYFGADVNAKIVHFYDDKFVIEYSTYLDKHISFAGKESYWVRDTTIYTMTFKKYVPKQN